MDTTGQAKWNDSLERYVFVYYKHLLTEAECQAWYYVVENDRESGLEGDDVLARIMGEAWKKDLAQDRAESVEAAKLAASRDPTIKRLIEDYPDQFFVSVTYRILRDHRDEVQLNLCPKCLNLCGTPKAKMCLRCGYSWHSEKE